MEKSVRTERKVGDYSSLTDAQHAYKIPDTFIGSAKSRKHKNLVYEDKKLIEKEVSLAEGAQRVFLEIISNAGDNCDASRRAKIDPGSINITANETKIRVQNGGLHIPVKKITLEKKKGSTDVREFKKGDQDFVWLPAFIFGQFRSSNNYDQNVKRMGCGRNGFGAKLTNIFSKKFIIEVEDPDSHLFFRGVWTDNMFKDEPEKKPEIFIEERKSITKGSVAVEWELDFKRFGMEKYSPEDLQLFCRFAVDFSFTCKIKTYFNGEELDYRSIKDYALLFWEESQLENHIIKYSWGKEAPKEMINATLKTQEKKILEAKKAHYIPELEVMIIDSPDASKNISYVNGLMTVEGGVHLDAVQDPIFRYICNIINGGKKRGKKQGITITSKNIRPHLSFIVNARLADPEYNSQSKTKLTYPPATIIFTDTNMKKIQEWETINRLFAEVEAIAYKSASSSDGKKKKHVLMDKGEDANLAGTKHSSKCKLFLVEGNSAANYPQKRICMLEGGKDYNGYMPLKGKFLNVTKAKPTQYAANQVISIVKQIVGLREELDYNMKMNLETLRYGFIILTVDADDDGMHILAHVLNFFREKFPGILQQNMIGYLRTPVIKVLKGDKIVKRFFSVKSFDDWKKNNSTKGSLVRYYKGLGTSNDKDIKDDLKHAPTIVCFYDSQCVKNLNLAFHEDNSDERKEWIEKWRDVTQVDDIISMDVSQISKEDKLLQGQDISQFINRELVGYSVASLFRAIPSEYDHLKDSQRKALYAALEFFHYDPKKGKSIKVGRFANKAADMTQYHHGEKSLIDTFIKMAQDFIGSNNMGYFKKDGQFGTRADGGDNAADARYSETHLAWWIPLVYQKESVDLVHKRVIDDEECEPLWLPGVIPMGIVNGTNGIATAFSTATPSHNPLEVIQWYKKKCKGEEPTPLMPWYNNFKGKMKIIDRTKSDDLSDEMLPADLDKEKPLTSPRRIADVERDEFEKLDKENMAILEHAKDCKLTLKTYGKFVIEGFHKNDGPIIKVTELPVRTWIHRYRKWLELLVQQKGKERPIYDFKDNSTTEKPYFEIHWNSNYRTPNEANLRLMRSFGISNITLIDHRGFPTRYSDIQEVMEKYYVHMIAHYEAVRKNRINIEENKVTDLSFKMKFIQHVLKNEIKIIKIKEDIIRAKMEELKIPFEYYEKSKSRDFSEESLVKYQKQLEEAKGRAQLAKDTSANKIWIGKLEVLEKEILKRKKGKNFNFES